MGIKIILTCSLLYVDQHHARFYQIHGGNLELLTSGRFHPPPRLDRGMESPRLDRVNTCREFADNF